MTYPGQYDMPNDATLNRVGIIETFHVFLFSGFFFSGFFFFFWNEMNFYLDEFQKINIGFKYKQIDLQMLQNI